MKGQSEIVVFVLLFLIGVILFVSAVMWSSGIFEQNVDMSKIAASETFMKDLNNRIQGVVRYGGKETIDYPLGETIELVGSDVIEIKMPVSVETVPKYWVNISKSDTSVIRERLDGNVFRLQLYYPKKYYGIEMFTEGPRLATPERIVIEENTTYKKDDIAIVKVKITFE